MCTWRPAPRRKLIDRVLDGATQRQLAEEFPASKTVIGDHLRVCVAKEIAEQKQHRHRALEWQPILDLLVQMSTAELKLAKLHTDLRDVATASKAIDRLLALVKQRADIAQRQRDGELRELSEALKEIAVLAFRYAPTQAPQQIANILADKPCAQALLKDLSDT